MTTTLGTGALDREETLLRTHTTCAATTGTNAGRGAFGAACGITGLAAHRGRHLDLGLFAFERFFKADFQIVAKIGAPALRPASARSTHEVAEEIVEHIREAAEVELPAGTRPAAAAVLKGGVSKLIVSGALLVVLQDLVGFVKFLETLLGRFVTGIAIGMMLHRRLAKGGFDLARRCLTANA